MAKKNNEEKLKIIVDPSTEPTKPVRASKKTVKAADVSETEPEYEIPEKTVPMKKRAKKEIQPSEMEAVEEAIPVMKSAAPKKVRYGKWVWLGILAMLLIAVIGSGIGYLSAINVRKAEETNQKLEAATTQYVLAQQDQSAGNLDMARQRLEYILTIYPEYPGLDAKLTEVMLALSMANPDAVTQQATPQVVVTPVQTVDTTKVSVLYNQAQSQLKASDWKGLLDTVNQMRYIDPSYESVKVDGMYYFAMAEQIAPLDNEIGSWKSWVSMFQDASSWYGIDWAKSADMFLNVNRDTPNLVDSSGYTAKQRYVGALTGYGDLLMTLLDYCNAAQTYETAKNVLSSDALLAKITQAQEYCLNPPAIPTPTVDPNQPAPTPTVNSYNATE